jgi:peptidoglycan/LPS O-acetylase OafA/YrhL
VAPEESKVAFPHQPALDGVRAIAVLAVLGFHLTISAADGGFIGVDIFFVLSGFLITTLLVLERRNTDRVALLAFWARRIRRLLPALLVLLLLVAVYAWFVAPPEQIARIRSDGLATLFYVENWHLAFTTGATSPLSHTWSLAIEEQWYLIWPPLFLLLAWLLRGRNRLLFLAALALAAGSAIDMALLGETRRAYYGTDARVQALLLGAALAFLLQFAPGPARRASRFALEAVGILGVLVLGAFVAHPVAWMGRGGYLVVALASVALIAAVVQPSSPVLRPVLSWRPLVALGLISYGVYLYHFVVIIWLNHARTGLGPAPLAVLRVVVTLAVATVSYLVVEMPVRRGTLLPKRVQAVAAPLAVAAMAVIVIVTTAGPSTSAAESSRIWSWLHDTAPVGAERVMLVGDGTPPAVALAMRGPYDRAGVRGVALGSFTCRLGDAVVVPGGGSTTAAGTPDCRRYGRQLEQAIGGYRPDVLVVATGGAPDVEVAHVAELGRLHPKARVVRLGAGVPVEGVSGGLTKPAARKIWAAIAADVARPSE